MPRTMAPATAGAMGSICQWRHWGSLRPMVVPMATAARVSIDWLKLRAGDPEGEADQ